MSRRALLAASVAVLLVAGTVGAVALAPASLAGSPADERDAQPTNDVTDTDADQLAAPASDTVTVSATGSAAAAPDQAVLQVAVRADGDDPASVRSTLATRASDLRSALDELGVSYETSQYSIRNVERRHRERSEDASSYEGVHAFTVTVDDPDRVGAVVDATADANATVDGVQLTLSADRRTELRNDAIRNAMVDAETQASTIAAAANLTLAGVATVDATESRYRPVAYETAAGGDGGGGPPTVIESGDVTVTYRVTVAYNATG